MPATVSAERRESIRERRLKVWRLRVVQKLTLAEIASAVGVSHGTVENDLASMRITRTDHLRRSQHTREASLDAAVEAMEECDAICRQAWSDLMAAPRGSATRAKFLQVLLTALARRVEILQSLGMLPREPEELTVYDGSIRDLTGEERDKVLAMIKAELRGREEEPPKGKAPRCRAA